MKKNFRSFKDSKNLISVINENNILVFMVFAFLLGELIGVLIFKQKNQEGTFYSTEFKSFLSGYEGGFGAIFFSSLLSVLLSAAVLFLSGTSMAGSILTPIILLLRGVNIALVSSYLYAHYGLNGIIFNILIIIPPAVLEGLALTLSAREAFGFSLSIARLALPNKGAVTLDNDFKIYCLRQLFILIFYLLSVIIKVIMVLSFYSFFKLG